jgi:hypothetical protein
MADNGEGRDISQDKTALFELLYHTRAWLEKHGYMPSAAKFALLWVYSIIESVGDDRLNAINFSIQEELFTLKHRVEALEDARDGG